MANIPDIVQAYNEAGAADEGEEDEGGDAAAGASADEDGGGGMKFVGKKKKGSTKKGKILGEKGDDISLSSRVRFHGFHGLSWI